MHLFASPRPPLTYSSGGKKESQQRGGGEWSKYTIYIPAKTLFHVKIFVLLRVGHYFLDIRYLNNRDSILTLILSFHGCIVYSVYYWNSLRWMCGSIHTVHPRSLVHFHILSRLMKMDNAFRTCCIVRIIMKLHIFARLDVIYYICKK